jgi:photosystem I subunit 11
MAESKNMQYIQPYNDDVYVGHLSTPISDSSFTRTFINNLPAYREGISPLLRGLEIGMAHGYFLVGPWTLLGPLRDSEGNAYLGGLIAAIGLILIATGALSAYGLTAFPKDDAEAKYFDDRAPENLRTRQGWSQFTGGFFVGAMGGAFVAYFLLENFSVVDSMLRGIVN